MARHTSGNISYSRQNHWKRYSPGGIKINYKTKVMTEKYEVIPGLYAAGVDANALYGDSYPLGLPGNTAGFAINSGRMAAENALEYIKSTSK